MAVEIFGKVIGKCYVKYLQYGVVHSRSGLTNASQCFTVDPANKDQTDPTKSENTAVTGYVGNWEDFAWDDQYSTPRGYVTNDGGPEDAPDAYGTLNRFTPDDNAMDCYNRSIKAERWCTLNSGTHD